MPTPTRIDEWGGDLLDTAAYFERIGHRGDRLPTVDTLRALHRGHVLAIPFENVDVVLGRPPRLDIDSLQDKLLRRGRGGYCYEHAVLFAALLERLGYTVTGLAGRVGSRRDQPRPRTHAALRVEVAGQSWLVDVGFGAERPLEPIPLVDGAFARYSGWDVRVDALDEGEWALRSARPDGWVDLYRFDLARHYPADYAVQNHYTATHPDSPFVSKVVAQRTAADARYGLRGTQLWITSGDGATEQQEVANDKVIDTLRDTFGIELTQEERAALAPRLCAME